MLNDENLFLAVQDMAKKGQKLPVLLLLAHVDQPAPPMRLKNKGSEIGFRIVTQWNLSAILKTAAREGLVAQLANGWKLTSPGLKALESHYAVEAPMVAETRHSLKSHLDKIDDYQRRAFLDEAVRSFDVKAYRAAIVLSWVGAVHIIQEHVITEHRDAFNLAGAARAEKYKSAGKNFNFIPIKSIKDFGTIGESDMLQVCQDAGVLHKAEKQILEDRLDLRNQCGHPNPIEIGEHTVAHHIEVLMLNVYSKY